MLTTPLPDPRDHKRRPRLRGNFLQTKKNSAHLRRGKMVAGGRGEACNRTGTRPHVLLFGTFDLPIKEGRGGNPTSAGGTRV